MAALDIAVRAYKVNPDFVARSSCMSSPAQGPQTLLQQRVIKRAPARPLLTAGR
jgi:hypothetical protein